MIGTKTEIRLARSKAGHDKGKCYVVVRELDECVYLADGKSRTVEAPKKKNRKHVQIIKRIPESVLAVLVSGDSLTDLEIKRALKIYNLSGEKQEEKECQKQM